MGMLFNTIDGIVFALLRMLPDSILIARIESQSARKQAEANEALVELGTLTAKFERETKEAKPLMDRKEAEIKALLAQGKEEAAASLMEEFESLEADYNEKKQAYDTSKSEFEVRVKEANIYLDKLQKRLRSIKNNSARTKAEEKLNNLRKAVSEKRFDVGGLNDDLNLLDERIKDRGDRVRGTSMVLDQDTKATAANVKVLEETRDAMNKARLARFAADRNIQISSTPRSSEPTPLGANPAAAEPENKQKA